MVANLTRKKIVDWVKPVQQRGPPESASDCVEEMIEEMEPFSKGVVQASYHFCRQFVVCSVLRKVAHIYGFQWSGILSEE